MNCINCQTELNPALDEDDCVCARCVAEQDHDYDAEPNVTFTRGGSIKMNSYRVWFGESFTVVEADSIEQAMAQLDDWKLSNCDAVELIK